MSDPFRGEPGTNPPRHIEPDSPNKSLAWTLGIVGSVFLLGVLFFSFATPEDTTASNPAVTTTGQGNRQPARPLPANPNATTPQPDPAQPAPSAR